MNTIAAKDKNNKTSCPKNKMKIEGKNSDLMPISAKVTAYVVGCASTTVDAVRRGDRSIKTATGQKILLADTLLKEGVSALIEEVKRVVKFENQ